MIKVVNLCFVLFFSLIIGLSQAVSNEQAQSNFTFSDPKELVLNLIDVVLNTEDFYKEDSFFETMENYFDFIPMGRFVLGPPARSLNKKQLEEFVIVFREYELLKMIPKIKGSDLKEVNFISIESSKDGKKAKLAFDIVSYNNSQPVRVHFYTRTDKKGFLKIWDVDIEGVRMLLRWRTEYQSIMVRKDFEGMMSILREKLEEKKDSLN